MWRQSVQWSFFLIATFMADWGMTQDSTNNIEVGRRFDSLCRRGFRYDINMGCVDINECEERDPCRRSQSCRNLHGSYICVCPAGFKLDRTTGECADKDECAMGYCGSGQTCINTVGSFTCFCSQGLTKIGHFCRDINECIGQPCDDNQYCINTRGSYLCRCLLGYHDVGDGSCTDTNECERDMCRDLGEVCQNTIGGYECTCREGYDKDQLSNGRYCIDVNECDQDQCPDHSECINTQGSFNCRCHRGFTKYNGFCYDNQECRLSEGRKCQWKCVNMPGSFSCECPSGYNRVDFACNDINECDSDWQRLCANRATCVNTHGGYKCIEPSRCPSGGFYRKIMTTDEFEYRQITTNMCRKKRCRRLTNNDAEYTKCRELPLSISYHYVDITSGLQAPTDIVRVDFPARRRRQMYRFSVSEDSRALFGLRQPSSYRPHAYLYLRRTLTGPVEYTVHVDMRTYNRRNQMRDSRMMTITVIVSRYEF